MGKKPEDYYCYMDCSEETLKVFLEHREVEYPKNASKAELARILKDNDIDMLDGVYIQPCDPNTCCPPIRDDADESHLGCEDCHPHFYYGLGDRILYWTLWACEQVRWYSVGLISGFMVGGE